VDKVIQQQMESWARAAGAVLKKHFRQLKHVTEKRTIELVTIADEEAEKVILEHIHQQYPDHHILAEESGAKKGSAPYRWIIDPLDGTTNYAHGLDHFCALLAFQEEKEGRWETQIGVTYDPMRDEMFTAQKNNGAFLNGQPIKVGSAPDLISSLLVTGFGYDRLYNPKDNHAEFCRLNLLTRGVRRYGSAGLDLAWVASGRFDGFWEYDLNPWDVAGGMLIAQEAGALITRVQGDATHEFAGNLAVANPVLHPQMVAALQSVKNYAVNSRDGLHDFLSPELGRVLTQKWSSNSGDAK
jgi:myo-inositol-1(or 4)-monophosphatase